MRFAFRKLPAATAGLITPRPTVDVWLDGFDATPLVCLVDTGALRTRFSLELAGLAGLDLDSAVSEDVHIGGTRVRAVPAQVSLRLQSANERFDWDATVWFCDPWPFPVQLLGMEGFLQRFRVTLSAYHEWLDCHPET